MIAQWIEESATPAPEDTKIFMGGDPRNPTWDEYLLEYHDDIKEQLIAIKDCYQKSGFDFYGEDMNNGYWKISDEASSSTASSENSSSTISFTWRGWGDFRQAMENKREGYLKYYMRGFY